GLAQPDQAPAAQSGELQQPGQQGALQPGQQGDRRPESGEPAARPEPGPLPSRQPRPPAFGGLQQSEPAQSGERPSPAFSEGPLPQPGSAGRPAEPPSTLPSRRGAAAAETPAPRQEEVTAEWNFGPDEGWRAVQAVSQSAPATFTSAGLPRRRRGEQLLPGSAGPPTGATAPRPQRDAHDVRGRLRSFQQGIERGRHRTARAETNHETLEGE
ncbi:histidine kinase, partial [Amycolatopsis sp. NPDC051106]